MGLGAGTGARTWPAESLSHLEGDDQVDILAHPPDEPGPQLTGKTDLGLL